MYNKQLPEIHNFLHRTNLRAAKEHQLTFYASEINECFSSFNLQWLVNRSACMHLEPEATRGRRAHGAACRTVDYSYRWCQTCLQSSVTLVTRMLPALLLLLVFEHREIQRLPLVYVVVRTLCTVNWRRMSWLVVILFYYLNYITAQHWQLNCAAITNCMYDDYV